MVTLPIEGSSERWTVGTVYCLGKNYRDHAIEMGQLEERAPVIFLKPAAALVDLEAPVELPPDAGEVHHEAELVLAVRLADGAIRPGDRLADGDAEQAISHMALGLDLTLRSLQSAAKKAGEPWSASKGFPGSAPISALRAFPGSADLAPRSLTLHVNGEERQSGRIDEMILSPARAVAEVAARFPLRTGDLIFTGTPAGVGPLQPGERIRLALGSDWAVETRVGP